MKLACHQQNSFTVRATHSVFSARLRRRTKPTFATTPQYALLAVSRSCFDLFVFFSRFFFLMKSPEIYPPVRASKFLEIARGMRKVRIFVPRLLCRSREFLFTTTFERKLLVRVPSNKFIRSRNKSRERGRSAIAQSVINSQG